jgi:DNA-directed RNA polymerase specialized sigma54-like protein
MVHETGMTNKNKDIKKQTNKNTLGSIHQEFACSPIEQVQREGYLRTSNYTYLDTAF